MKKLVALFVLLALLIVAAVVFATVHNNKPVAEWTKPTPATKRVLHSSGGSVRIAVSTPPQLGDTGEGGQVLRSLVEPHLFIAQPNGTWAPSIVKVGSDGASKDGLTAWFIIRSDAKWSDGSAITLADLQRTVDTRFVSSVTGPAADGRITLHFKSKLPSWRMLWSGSAGIAPPSATVYGGPFKVANLVSGELTTVVRNPSYYEQSNLDSVELDYVPDSTMARQLFAAHDVDVVQPVADTVRTKQYQTAGATLSSTTAGGRWVGLQFNSNTANAVNSAALASFPRSVFVNALLANEASVYNGFATKDTTWMNTPSNTGGGTTSNLSALNATLTVPTEDPMATVLSNAFARAVTQAGGKLAVRSTDSATVTSLLNATTYDVAMVSGQTQPDTCWTCTFGSVNVSLARDADAGNKDAALALERDAKNYGVFVPTWKDNTVVAYNSNSINGIKANGYSSSVAWNAEDWWTK